MADFKEAISIKSQSAFVGFVEGIYGFRQSFKAMPKIFQAAALFFVISMIPVFLVLRFGTQKYLESDYSAMALVAHPAIKQVSELVVGKSEVFKNPAGFYSAYAEVTNPNLDLSIESVGFTFSFYGESGAVVNTFSDASFFLPNESKILVAPRIESSEAIKKVSLQIAKPKWQKRLDIPDVNLKVFEPAAFDSVNPLQYIAEGSFVNDSVYTLGKVRLTFLLFDKSGKVISVSQRDEFNILPNARRAYRQIWPQLYKSDISKIKVEASTNSLSAQNIGVSTAATPTISEADRGRKS